ncbi:MAG TPA: tetratricopeptide repeat protein [Candidatus Kryptonia bacterium]
MLGLVLNAKGQDSYDILVGKGRDLAYNVRFEEAESLFTEAARISPGRAESYFNIAQVHLWLFLWTNNRGEYETFTRWYDSTVTKSEKIIDSNPGDYRATYLLGETYQLRAIAGVAAHSYLDAFWATKSASGSFERTLKLAPDFYDAYRGAGEIHYFLDFLPGSVKWAITLFGMEANKAKGFSELRLAHEKGTLDKVKSALSLAQIYSDYVAEYDSAEILMRELVTRFPRNPLFNYHLAVILIREGRLHEAEKHLDTILNLNDPDFAVLNNLSVFLKGDIHFKLNDFRNAVKYNKMFLENTKEPDYSGIANYRLAVSYRAIGNDSLMKKSLSDAMHGNDRIYDDAQAKSRSKLFLKRGISSDELMTIEMKNNIDAGEYENVYSTLMPVVDQIQDMDARAEAFLLLSESAIHMGEFSEGTRFATMADSIDRGDDERIEPMSWYLTALGNYRLGDLSGARRSLRKVKDTSEYGSNNILSARVNNLERHLNPR